MSPSPNANKRQVSESQNPHTHIASEPGRDAAPTRKDSADAPSSSISSSTSISSPGCRPSSWITSRASLGRLKLVLRLELPLPPRPGVDDRPPCVPTLENDVRRDGGPEPPPVVAPVLLTGDMDRTGDIGLPTRPFRSRDGISGVRVGTLMSMSMLAAACARTAYATDERMNGY